MSLLEKIPSVLLDIGVLPIDTANKISDYYDVLLDGKIVGIIPASQALGIVQQLRVLKVQGTQAMIL